jgi:hypothetical protein
MGAIQVGVFPRDALKQLISTEEQVPNVLFSAILRSLVNYIFTIGATP